MPLLNIDVSKFDDLILPWFKECTPRLLVVTDNLNYSPGDAFGLTEFVDTLRASTIHGMTPIVITASFHPSAALSYDATNQHITNYKFADATHGVRKSRYDVVFILSINGESGPLLTDEPGALAALTKFMQDGGGVFATGDHEDLGAGMCKDIPRVRSMRYWLQADTPSAGGTDRLTTNLAGANQQYEFDDQSDASPQRLYVNFRPDALGNGHPHPLVQVPASTRAIEVFPDHPHEGECVVPTNLTTKLLDGITDEWPVPPVGGARPSPEMVALTMSHGNAFPGKDAVVPRSFIAICAYDGQSANVGRVVTDATWHHFVNINIKPGLAALTANDLNDIKQYYRNLATWLMPKNVRRCRRFPVIIWELVQYPLFEELRPIPMLRATGLELRDMGAVIEDALVRRYTRDEVSQMLDDSIEDALGPDGKVKIEKLGKEFGRISVADAGRAAIASIALATADVVVSLKDRRDVDGHHVFDDAAKKAATLGVQRYLEQARNDLRALDELIATISR
jgi:hypothetical protein